MRIHRAEVVILEALCLGRRGCRGLDQDVGGLYQAHQDVVTSRRLNVERDRALPGVVVEVVQPVLDIGVLIEKRCHPAKRSAVPGLDANNVGAEVRKQPRSKYCRRPR